MTSDPRDEFLRATLRGTGRGNTLDPTFIAQLRARLATQENSTPHARRGSHALLALFALAACALIGVLYFQFTHDDPAAPIHDYYFADEAPETAAQVEIATDSPMFRGNAARTGYYPGGLGKLKPGEKNRSIVFVSANDHHLYALDAATGEQLWKFRSNGNVPFQNSPVVVNGICYHVSSARLDALNAVTGKALWKFENGASGYSPPAVVGNTLYIGSNARERYLYALNASTGEELWKFQTSNCIYKSPAVANGIVYVGPDDGKYLYALNATNGEELWSFEVSNTIASSPAVVDGIAYISSNDGYLYALNADSGKELWNIEINGAIYSSPTVSNGVVYVISNGNHIHALSTINGEALWDFTPSDDEAYGEGFTSPAATNDAVYAISHYDSRLYALQATTGKELWHFETGKNGFSSSPAVANGTVYVGPNDNHLYALDAASGKELWKFKTDGWSLYSPVVADFAEPGAKPRTPARHMIADDSEVGQPAAIHAWEYDADWSTYAHILPDLFIEKRDGKLYANFLADSLFGAPPDPGQNTWREVGISLDDLRTLAAGNTRLETVADTYWHDTQITDDITLAHLRSDGFFPLFGDHRHTVKISDLDGAYCTVSADGYPWLHYYYLSKDQQSSHANDFAIPAPGILDTTAKAGAVSRDGVWAAVWYQGIHFIWTDVAALAKTKPGALLGETLRPRLSSRVETPDLYGDYDSSQAMKKDGGALWMAFAPDNSALGVCGLDKTLYIYSMKDVKKAFADAVKLQKDKADADGVPVELENVALPRDFKPALALKHDSFIRCVAFSYDGKACYTASRSTLTTWDLHTGKAVQTLDLFTLLPQDELLATDAADIMALAPAPDGSALIATLKYNRLMLLKPAK